MDMHGNNLKREEKKIESIEEELSPISFDPLIREWSLELRERLTHLEFQRNITRPCIERTAIEPEISEGERERIKAEFDEYSRVMKLQSELVGFLVRTLSPPCEKKAVLLKEVSLTYEHPLVNQAIMEAYSRLPHAPVWVVQEAKGHVFEDNAIKTPNGFSRKELSVLAAHATLDDGEANRLYDKWLQFQWNDFVSLGIMNCLGCCLRRREDSGHSLLVGWFENSISVDEKQRILRLAQNFAIRDVVRPEGLLKCMVDTDELLSRAATRYASLLFEIDERVVTNLRSQVSQSTSRASDAAIQLSFLKPHHPAVEHEIFELLVRCEEELQLGPFDTMIKGEEELPFSGTSSSGILETRAGYQEITKANLFGSMHALGNIFDHSRRAVERWESYLYHPDPIYREILINSFPSQVSDQFYQKILLPFFSRISIEALPNSTMRLMMYSKNAHECVERLVQQISDLCASESSTVRKDELEQRAGHLLGVKLLFGGV